jgi:hypothetical protein
MTKGDFFPLFWSAWGAAFKPQTIRRSFEATGIHSLNADVILKKYRKEESSSDESSASCLSEEDWLKLESIIRRMVKDQSDKNVKKLCRSLHHISVQNSILHGEIRGLRDSLLVKKRLQKKSVTLQLSKPQEYYGGAVF